MKAAHLGRAWFNARLYAAGLHETVPCFVAFSFTGPMVGIFLFPIPSLSKLRGMLCAFVVLSQGLVQIINKKKKQGELMRAKMWKVFVYRHKDRRTEPFLFS